MDKLEHYESCFSEVYPRKFVQADPRLGDFVLGPGTTRGAKVKAADARPDAEIKPTQAWAVVGHPDDEGISVGGGRKGAALGPGAIRRHLFKMTPHMTFSENEPRLFDFGDLAVSEFNLARRHEVAEAAQLRLYREGFRVMTFGGGHDYGFPDAAAFLRFQLGDNRTQGARASDSAKPLVMNIDAHMDVRPVEDGLSSGTPFYRLLSEFDPKSFDFLEIGIQSQCNAAGQLAWARDRGAQILTYDEILMSGLDQSVVILQFLAEKLTSRKRAVFLSVDMDAFEAPFGSGTSAPATVGLRAEEFLKVLATLAARLSLCGLGLYESAPALDHGEMTSRFAARLAFETLCRA